MKAIDWAITKEVDIISMSWAADLEVSSDDEEKLSSALNKAMNKHKIPTFCANPDKGRGYTTNETYPYKAHPDKIFCIGAETSSGSQWRKIDPNDKSAHFYLPGVDLGIPVHAREGKDQPPGKWEKYSGSSLSCALAAGLAAMILHIAKVCEVSNEDWKKLKTREGMKAAFEKIDVTDGWLPVRKLFDLDSLRKGNDESKKEALKNDVVDWIIGKKAKAPWELAGS